MTVSPLAGQPAPATLLVDVSRLVAAYYADVPDPAVPAQRVAFGTSGHRGSALRRTFNEAHILAITQAICAWRAQQGIDGPLYLGVDTHALSGPARDSALEVLAANGVHVMLAEGDAYTPTPVVSHAILVHNRGRDTGLADGIVVTPSHNPPEDGGFKYNPPHGGPAETSVTRWIEDAANRHLAAGLSGVKRVPVDQALRAATTRRHDYRTAYVADLANVIDLAVVRGAGLRVGVDPMGGAGVHYWGPIAERYGLDLVVVNATVDPTFAFMPVDGDGRIRMDPSSPYAMRNLVAVADRFDVAVACDTDHDRHGVVVPGTGLLPPNHYLAVAIDHLFRHRPQWSTRAGVGKTVVSSALIDRVTARLGRALYETPVGFKWFVGGLHDGALGFAGEESAGASLARHDGSVWTTDKDGIALALLAAEITARAGRDPGALYGTLSATLGAPLEQRIEAPATAEQKQLLATLTPEHVHATQLAGEPVRQVLTRAPGNGEALGGVKVVADSGWFAARPSGTEDIYKIYAESFRDAAHLARIVDEARALVDTTLGAGARGPAAG